MKCSRCGCYQPNPSCYVCQSDEAPRETPDHDGGSLLKTMTKQPDSAARFWASFALVCCVTALVIMAACGCKDFEGYLAVTLLAIMSGFIGVTSDI